MTSDACHPKGAQWHVRSKDVGVGIDSDLDLPHPVIHQHIEEGKVVGPLRRVHQLHTFQFHHTGFGVFPHFLNQKRFLGVEPTALVNQRVHIERRQAIELAHNTSDTHAVSLVHFVPKVADWAEHIDPGGGVNQGEAKRLGVIVPAVHHAAQLTSHIDAVQHPLVVVPADLGNVIDGVGQIRRQDVDHHRFNSKHRATRHDGHGQLHVLLKLRIFFVDGGKGEGLAVQKACFKIERQREHGGVVGAWSGVSPTNRHEHFHVFKRVAHLHFHVHALALGHVKLGRGKPNHHRAQTTARRAVVAQEVEGVLGINIPLGLAHAPKHGTFANVGLSHQGVL